MIWRRASFCNHYETWEHLWQIHLFPLLHQSWKPSWNRIGLSRKIPEKIRFFNVWKDIPLKMITLPFALAISFWCSIWSCLANSSRYLAGSKCPNPEKSLSSLTSWYSVKVSVTTFPWKKRKINFGNHSPVGVGCYIRHCLLDRLGHFHSTRRFWRPGRGSRVFGLCHFARHFPTKVFLSPKIPSQIRFRS